jgi:hypothetical protein
MAKATETQTPKKRNRRDPAVVFSETTCRSARQAASLAAKEIAKGVPAPEEVLLALSNMQGCVMAWLMSANKNNS